MIQVDNYFPFAEDVFLSSEPMNDEEFEAFARIVNDEIPIESVDFTDPVLG